MTKLTMQITQAELEKQAKDALAVLEKLTAVHVPKSLKDALDEDWLATFSDGGLEVMEHVPEAELKAWKSRAITMQNANLILRVMEEKLVREFVHRPDSFYVIATRRLTAVPKFIASHIGEIVSFAVPLVLELSKAIADDHANALVIKAIEARIEFETILPNPDVDLIARLFKDLKVLDARQETLGARLAIVVIAVTGLVGYWTVERLISMAITAAAFKAKVATVISVNLELRANAVKWCLPQAKRRSLRKRKRSRRK